MTGVTVIVPTCDRPVEFLRAAIESALSQTLRPVEVIVVDNGLRSVDGARLPDGCVLFRLPPRVGPSRARNFGAAMAKGSHLAFLDDDDWWDSDFLRQASAVLQHEGTRCVYGRLDQLRAGSVARFKSASALTLTIPVLLHRNPGAGGSNLVVDKALFWSVGGFDPNLYSSEDRALAVEILRSGERVSVAPCAVAVVRAHDGDRLSNVQLRKLWFVWRYRALYGPVGVVAEGARILHKVSKHRIKESV